MCQKGSDVSGKPLDQKYVCITFEEWAEIKKRIEGLERIVGETKYRPYAVHEIGGNYIEQLQKVVSRNQDWFFLLCEYLGVRISREPERNVVEKVKKNARRNNSKNT